MTFVSALLVMRGVAAAAELPASLVDPFVHVQTALAADRIDGLEAHARAIEAAAALLGKDADGIVAGAKKLAAAKDIAAARTAFGEMSTALFAYADKTKATFPAGIKLAYCPMADKSWIQKDKDLKNPYYGAAMLTCGSFKS
jgi:hypothetical protein